MNTQRRTYVSCKQKLALLRWIELNPQIKSGKFSAEFTYQAGQKAWQGIAVRLNTMGPAQKSWKQWRKTWQDLKVKSKRKGTEIEKECDIKERIKERMVNLIEPVKSRSNTRSSAANKKQECKLRVVNPLASTTTHVPTGKIGTIAPLWKIYPKVAPIIPNTTQNVENVLFPNNVLDEQTKRKLKMKQDYYDHKLKIKREKLTIYKEEVEQKRRIADALELFVKSLI